MESKACETIIKAVCNSCGTIITMELGSKIPKEELDELIIDKNEEIDCFICEKGRITHI